MPAPNGIFVSLGVALCFCLLYVLLAIADTPPKPMGTGRSVFEPPPLRTVLDEEDLVMPAERPFTYTNDGYVSGWNFGITLRQAYGVVPFVEIPPKGLEPRGALRLDIHQNLEVPITVSGGQTLKATLERMEKDSAGLITWDCIHGILCVFPSELPEGVLPLLDTRVSLSVERVSPWEAFKLLGATLNEAIAPSRVQVNPLGSLGLEPRNPEEPMPAWGYAPPAWFTERGTVSLSLENVSAREAVCAIVAASPEPLRMRYTHHREGKPDRLSINFLWEAYDPGPEKSREDMLYWVREMHSASGLDPDSAVLYGADAQNPHQTGNPEGDFAKMTPEEERAYEVKVMRMVADLALIPPKLNTNPMPEYDPAGLDYGMTIGIDRTPGGRIWAAWVAGGDSPKAYFLLATSDDDGETWSPPRLVIDGHSPKLPMDRSIIVGNLWTDPLGRLWLFFDQAMNHFDGRGGLWATRCDNPDAEAPAWSAPRRIWHGSMLNKPTVLSTGEWMLPVQLLVHSTGIGPFEGIFPELDPYRGANVFVSTDAGANFERRGCVRLPYPDWIEHMVLDRRDGSLWMLARTTKGIMESVSEDRGGTWSEPAFPEGIRHANSRFHLRRLASGRVLLVKHGDTMDSHEGRSKLKAFLSEDDGHTWVGGLMLDERNGVSYPDGFQAPDGTIYISHDRERGRLGEVLLSRFNEEDILAGKLVSPRSKLKMLIYRPGKLIPDAQPQP